MAMGAQDGDSMLGFMFFGGFVMPDGTSPPEGLYSFKLERAQ